jgi:predicted DNA-binding transcriptional regulator AlpA
VLVNALGTGHSTEGKLEMTSQLSAETESKPHKSVPTSGIKLLTPKEAAEMLKVSVSWLAKARMRGDGPAYIKVGRSIRYTEIALQQWLKAHQHLSTSEH